MRVKAKHAFECDILVKIQVIKVLIDRQMTQSDQV